MDIVATTVNRSKRLTCKSCGQPLPMRSTACFRLDGNDFVAAYCRPCVNADPELSLEAYDSERHPFDLED